MMVYGERRICFIKKHEEVWRLLLHRMRHFMASCRDALPHKKRLCLREYDTPSVVLWWGSRPRQYRMVLKVCLNSQGPPCPCSNPPEHPQELRLTPHPNIRAEYPSNTNTPLRQPLDHGITGFNSFDNRRAFHTLLGASQRIFFGASASSKSYSALATYYIQRRIYTQTEAHDSEWLRDEATAWRSSYVDSPTGGKT